MKIIFLQPASFEYQGPMILSAVLKRNGHQCDLFMGDLERDLISSVRKSSPDFVAFSCTTGMHLWALEMAQKIKEGLDCLTIFGGSHPTYFPEIIENKQVDIVCRGEGEYALLELANNMEEGKDIGRIKNLWVKRGGRVYKNDLRNFISDLDELPFADRTLYYKYKVIRDYPVRRFLAGRGCPYQCTFCYASSYRKMYQGKGRHVRMRSVENVIKEMEEVRKKHKMSTVEFVDDAFGLNHTWLHGFLKEYKKRVSLPFNCMLRADQINDRVTMELRSAGCHSVALGIESGNEHIRNDILKKALTDKHIIDACALLKKYDIKFVTFNIVGIPGETVENIWETVRMNIEVGADWPSCSIFQPYPRTDLSRYALDIGFIDRELNVDEINSSWFKHSVLKLENKREIENLQKLFFFAVKQPKLISIIKLLNKLPPNKVYDLIFQATLTHRYLGVSRLTFFKALRLGLYLRKFY